MGKFVKGDVVVVPFPFTDFSEYKRRPALVVTSLSGDDVILCMITTRSKIDQYSVNLSSVDFSDGGIAEESIIRPNKLFTADSNRILSKKGSLIKNKIDEVVNRIIQIVRV